MIDIKGSHKLQVLLEKAGCWCVIHSDYIYVLLYIIKPANTFHFTRVLRECTPLPRPNIANIVFECSDKNPLKIPGSRW